MAGRGRGLAAGVRGVPGPQGRRPRSGVNHPIRPFLPNVSQPPPAVRQAPPRAADRLLERAAVPDRLGLTAAQGTYFGFTESPVPSGRTDAADPAGGRPPGNRLRGNSEEGCDLARSEKALIVAIHARSPPDRSLGPLSQVWRQTCVLALDSGKPACSSRPPGSAASCPGGNAAVSVGPVQLVSVDEIRSAAARLDGGIVRTPLVPFPRVTPRLLIKPESLQPTGAFKLRGAYAA